MTKTIFFAGNKVNGQDDMPLKLLPFLSAKCKKYHFVHFDPTEDIQTSVNEIVIIDTVKGISDVTVFRSLDYFARSPTYSVHDYDLLLHFQLLNKLRKIRHIIIIGVPSKGDIKQLTKQIEIILAKL